MPQDTQADCLVKYLGGERERKRKRWYIEIERHKFRK